MSAANAAAMYEAFAARVRDEGRWCVHGHSGCSDRDGGPCLDECYCGLSDAARAIVDGSSPDPVPDPDEYPPRCSNPGGHEWGYSGSAYGGDDERWHGEGRCLCVYCGADGDG